MPNASHGGSHPGVDNGGTNEQFYFVSRDQAPTPCAAWHSGGRAGRTVLRFPAVLPARGHLRPDRPRRVDRCARRLLAGGRAERPDRLACPRNAVRLRGGGAGGVRADSGTELDGQIAGGRPAAARPRDVGDPGRARIGQRDVEPVQGAPSREPGAAEAAGAARTNRANHDDAVDAIGADGSRRRRGGLVRAVRRIIRGAGVRWPNSHDSVYDSGPAATRRRDPRRGLALAATRDIRAACRRS